VTKLGV